MRKVWRCDACGHEWIPTGEGKPVRCPSRKCRSGKWDQEIVEAIREAEGKAVGPAKVVGANAVPPAQSRRITEKLAAGASDEVRETIYDSSDEFKQQ